MRVTPQVHARPVLTYVSFIPRLASEASPGCAFCSFTSTPWSRQIRKRVDLLARGRMDRFIATENIRRFKQQLQTCSDEERRLQLERLLEAEEAKLRSLISEVYVMLAKFALPAVQLRRGASPPHEPKTPSPALRVMSG